MPDLSSKMVAGINEQIQAELASAYLYLAMSAWLEEQNLKGMAHWMKKQAEEEWEHTCKFIEYLQTRGCRVLFDTLPKPEGEYEGVLPLFKAALNHERYISERILKMTEIALAEKDYMSASMLKWFIDEQVEEEAAAADIVKKLEFVGAVPGPALYCLDREMGER